MFRVEWKPAALNDLTTLWTSSGSGQRRAITAAAHAIEQQLRIDPQNQGESRPNGRRILFAPPLGVRFRVHPQRSTVDIFQVWTF
jgi:hypothetical protein